MFDDAALGDVLLDWLDDWQALKHSVSAAEQSIRLIVFFFHGCIFIHNNPAQKMSSFWC